MNSKVIISGGSGFIGSHLAKKLAESGYKVYILSRHPREHSFKSEKVEFVKWEQHQRNEFYKEFFEGAKAVINLAGASIGAKRWTGEYKKVLYYSRIDTTRKIVDIMKICSIPPECLISASGTGAYKDSGNEVITESSELGNDFLANLCKDWEAESLKAETSGVRVVISRNAVVLGKDDGALPEMIRPFKFFIGGYQGKGNQWFPWIHIDDCVDILIWMMEPEISGVINTAAPNPETNKNFCKKLAKAINRPCLFRIPGFMLKIVLGEFAETLLVSQRVIPRRATENGFTFKFEQLDDALNNLLPR